MRFRIATRDYEAIEITDHQLITRFADWVQGAGRAELERLIGAWMAAPYDLGGLGMAVPDDQAGIGQLCEVVVEGWAGPRPGAG